MLIIGVIFTFISISDTILLLHKITFQILKEAQKYDTIVHGNVTWIDNFGLRNELVSVDGGWIPGYKNKLLNKVVEYGANTNNPDSTAIKTPSENTYSYAGTSSMQGCVMFLDSTVQVDGASLRLRVVGSILS